MRAALFALLLVASPARAAVTPDPGGASAWGAGLALLADAPGPLAVFDQPARLDDRTSPARRVHIALGASRARLFELDALTRTRLALSAGRGPLAAALALETFGPEGARQTRVALGVAARRGSVHGGMAWNEHRAHDTDSGAGALDAGLVVGVRPRLTFALAARSLASGGDPAARPDPDWTIEGALDAGVATFHLARTRDLSGGRTGGGIALVAGPLQVVAGAVGPPTVWSLAIGARGGPARAAFARTTHPSLGASDLIDGTLSW